MAESSKASDKSKKTEGRKPGFLRREVLPIAIVVAVSLVARGTVLDHYHVPSESMVPTIEVCDRVVVNKHAFGLRLPLTNRYLFRTNQPARGDVVILASPEDGKTLIKRVVGRPGDVIEVTSDGRIYLEGDPVHIDLHPEAYHSEWLPGDDADHRIILGGQRAYSVRTIPDSMYLVMGDNRGNSRDGREFGFVDEGAIYGRAAAIYHRGCEGLGFTWLKF